MNDGKNFGELGGIGRDKHTFKVAEDQEAMAPEETWVVTLVEVQWGRQEGVQWHLAITTWDPEGKGLVRPQETLGCSRYHLQGP